MPGEVVIVQQTSDQLHKAEQVRRNTSFENSIELQR
jgi:hypothetical protein